MNQVIYLSICVFPWTEKGVKQLGIVTTYRPLFNSIAQLCRGVNDMV
jgi:hypothetical protein